MAEQLRGALHIHRTAEIISLSVSAAGGKEKVRLSLSLHTLGYNLNTKFLRKANCGAHDCGIARIGCDPEDELLREFQPVDGVYRQIFHRGITGSKIVDCDSDAEVPKAFERVSMLLRNLHQYSFRKLDFDVARIDVPPCQTGGNFKRQVGRPFYLHTGNIHGEEFRCDSLIAPPLEPAATLLEHPMSERHDCPCPLRDRDENRRHDEAARRVVPANQRLYPDDPTRVDFHLRLIVELELGTADREAQFLSKCHAQMVSVNRFGQVLPWCGRRGDLPDPTFLRQ